MQFRVVDPPASPLKPVAPKRPLLLAMVLIGGIIAGGAFAFLLTQIDDSILSVRQLKELVPLPVLGGISLVTTDAQKRQNVVGALGFLAATLVPSGNAPSFSPAAGGTRDSCGPRHT